jgi:hypothetical protein
MNQDAFLNNIKSTWQTVELPHKSMLKKAKRNAMWYRLGVAYSAISSLLFVIAGAWIILNSNADVVHWLVGLTFIFLVPGLAFFSTKKSWRYAKWEDRSALGTFSQLITQCNLSIRMHKLAKKVALSYALVPAIGVSVHFLELTQVPLKAILAASAGLLLSTIIIVLWAEFRIRRKNAELLSLRQMLSDSENV